MSVSETTAQTAISSGQDRSEADRARAHSRKQLVRFIALIQSILFLAHLFLYSTWTFSAVRPGSLAAKFAAGVLSVSFVAASLLASRYTHAVVPALYTASAIWLGLLNLLVPASLASWIVFGIARLGGLDPNFHRILEIFSGIALLLGIYGIFNASWTRTTRATVRLPKLPEAWRGRRAALVSDLHLGPVRNAGFLRRIVAQIRKEKPEVVFIAGDLFDGTAIDVRRAAETLKQLTAPQGVYFVAGNHEQFVDDSKYLDAIAAVGVRVLRNEKVEAEGLQIIGVPYRNATQRDHLASVLQALGLDRNRASILLVHAPDYPAVAEAAGVSLQLSGHTHGGQFVPWTWLVRRFYRQFAYGLSRTGGMQVFTSSGAGTWGPPLRLGSKSEIVILEME